MSESLLREELAALRSEVAELRKRLDSLAPAASDEIDPEILAVISATIAAYLGKRATIKFVRRAQAESDSWSSQGRVVIQGSHQLNSTH